MRRIACQVGLQALPMRWVDERALAWISRIRRTVRDYERLLEHHAAWVQWTMVWTVPDLVDSDHNGH